MPAVIRDFKGEKHIFITFAFSYTLLSRVKTTPDRSWKPELDGKPWIVPATPWHAKEVMRIVGDAIHMDITVRNLAAQAAIDTSVGRDRGGVYPFQSGGIDFGHRCQGRWLNCDDMGLGKTVQALVGARELRARKILVVCPSSVSYKWLDEIAIWYPEASAQVIPSTISPLPSDINIHVMSYAIMTRKEEDLKSVGYDLVIFDEFHKLKNPKAQRTKAARRISRKIKWFCGLSGTPLLNKPIELYQVLNMVASSVFGHWPRYVNRYCGNVQLGIYDEAKNLAELKEKLSSIMIRRLKTDVLDQLPDLTRIRIPVDIDRSLYNAAILGYESKIEDALGKQYDLDKPIVLLQVLRRIIGREKARISLDMVFDILDTTPGKLVLYVVYLDTVEYLKSSLERYGVSVITGKVSAKKRAEVIDDWQTTERSRVMIITSAGGEGIDLFGRDDIECSRMVFIEREWGPAPEEQAEARLHRIGQSSGVQVVYMIARGTYDIELDNLISAKRRILRDAVGLNQVATVEAEILKYLQVD